VIAVLLAAALATPAPVARSEARARCAVSDPLRRPFFGDLHVHTGYSLDASTQGVRSRPDDAYRFAKGEPLGIPPYDDSGAPLRTLRLHRPLDFAVVTDHAELFGERAICDTAGLPGHESMICRLYRRWPRLAFYLMNGRASRDVALGRYGFCGPQGRSCLAAARTPWRDVQEAAEAHYDRTPACRFTTFVGYEWTGAPDTKNLHRNVIFHGSTVPELPVSYIEATSPDALWRALHDVCLDTGSGCDALTIPHNSNLSGGLMFEPVREDGKPADAEWARTRQALEPLVEIMQHKGDSECIPGAGVSDEQCSFEKLPYDRFGGKYLASMRHAPEQSNFIRDALKRGLVLQRQLGVDPFKYGLVGSTDTHLGAAGFVDERTHPGHGGAGAPAPSGLPPGLPDDAEFNPGGLAVLWAEENSRDALFAAMRRREAYGTSGPRVVVRFFGGWDYPPDLCDEVDLAARGYAGGVPMGGDLPPRSTAGAPVFVVSALRDPDEEGAPLQRIQIIKGWLGADGKTHEHVWDVAGDTSEGGGVDAATCTQRGGGAPSLCAVWRDPEFDAAQPAFWYARVLQEPTCRWTQWACIAHHVDCTRPETVGEGLAPCCDPALPRTIQERAWASPIWYVP
jgi:Protein of unknown function (DUF3604)